MAEEIDVVKEILKIKREEGKREKERDRERKQRNKEGGEKVKK